MRRLLGLLLPALLLAGCGSSDGPSTGPTAGADPAVTLVSATAGGGDEATQATLLPDEAALTSYVAQFDDAFAQQVTAAAGRIEVGDDEVLAAQVVSIGCQVPKQAEVRWVDGGWVMTATSVPTGPAQECFAPVTTVGLTALPPSQVASGS